MRMRWGMGAWGALCGALVCSVAFAATDQFGYRSIASTEPGGPVIGTFTSISGTGTRLTLVSQTDFTTLNPDESGAFNLSLGALNGGAGFPFYGSVRPTAHLTTNGFLGFTLMPSLTTLVNQCPLPEDLVPNDGIAVLWDDLVLANPPDMTRGAYQQSFATCPYAQGGAGACVVFEWHNAYHFNTPAQAFTAQAVLYDSGNVLLIYRGDNPEAGSSSTTGLDGPEGLVGLSHACNTAASIPNDSAVLITAPKDGRFGLTEVEPNDELATATTLPVGTCGAGALVTTDGVDHWRLAGTAPGDRLFAYVDTQAGGFTVDDAALDVIVGSGDTVIATDENSGVGDGPAVAGVPLPLGGDVVLRVRQVIPDGTVAPYMLMSYVAPAAAVVPEVEPNDAVLEAKPVLAPVMVGALEPFELDHYAVPAEVGDVITVILDADPDRNGTATRASIVIVSPDANSGIGSSDGFASQLAWAAGRGVVTQAGTQYVRVRRTAEQGESSYQVTILKNCRPFCADADGDGACDGLDNCAGAPNDQADGDGDGVGDACDACAADGTKVAPGSCGCGVVDGDANGNGVLDCLPNAELRERLDRLTDALNALTKTKRKKPNPTADATRARLEDAVGYVRSAPAGLSISGDGGRLTTDVEAAVNRALKGGAFKKKRKKALAAVQALREAVAP